MNLIEQHFYHLADNNDLCDSWVAQWKLAKKRAPMILDVISHVFPHYSLHNAMLFYLYDVDDEIINCVYEKRYDQSVTKEQIKAVFFNLIKTMKMHFWGCE